MRPSSLEAAHQETTEPKKTVMQELFGEEKAAFSQHYILYSVSVIVRTGVEVVFIYLQYQMFGFRVKELFKCTGDPCPNTVDCFISRPMEKTIFLWFMFIIAFLCLFLNVLELLYLFFQFCVRRPRLERRRRHLLKRPTTSESQTLNMADAEILDGGTISAPQTATAPPAYRNGVDVLYGVDQIDLTLLESQPKDRLPFTSFSIEDSVLPENFVPATSKYQSYQENAVSESSNSNNLGDTVVALQDAPADQPYLAYPKADLAKPKGYYGYV